MWNITFTDSLLSTLMKHLWQQLHPWVFLGMRLQAHLYLWSFSPADPLKLFQVGCGASLHSYFQDSPEMFDRVQVRALAEQLKDIQSLVPKPLLHCLGCWLRVFVLLEGEPIFHQGSLCTLPRSSFPWFWLVSQSLPLKNNPTAWCCHHHASP